MPHAPVRVLIWNEFRHEKKNEAVRALYPEGLHAAIARGIAADDLRIQLAALDDDQQGITAERLSQTDVLFWWGHGAHLEVHDETVERVRQQVLEGMGLVVLHSGHDSKIFKRLLGTSGSLKWREAKEREILWNLAPAHPLMEGIGDCIDLSHEEMYGERFDVPEPDELLMLSWFAGGEVFRSLCTWQRGHGRVVYFRPGHETYPTYHQQDILKVLGNAARWAARRVSLRQECINAPPRQPLPTSSEPNAPPNTR